MRTVNAIHTKEQRFRQQENAQLTYTVNWAAQLDTGDTISASAWSTEDSGVTIASESNTTTTASAQLSADSPGSYRIVNKVTTANGDVDERIIALVVEDNDETAAADDYWFVR